MNNPSRDDIQLELFNGESQSRYGSTPMHNHMNWRGGHWGFLRSVSDYVEVLLYIMGYQAVAPFQSSIYRDDPRSMADNCRKTIANWSERHIAEACGLGTFGLNGMIIAEKGVAVNLFSLVCNTKIPPIPKKINQQMGVPCSQSIP